MAEGQQSTRSGQGRSADANSPLILGATKLVASLHQPSKRMALAAIVRSAAPLMTWVAIVGVPNALVVVGDVSYESVAEDRRAAWGQPGVRL